VAPYAARVGRTDFVEPRDLEDRVRRGLRAAWGREATSVGHATGRVNLVGEHTDYNGGPCLPIPLPHSTWAAVALRDDAEVRVASAQADGTWSGADVSPGRVAGWAAYVTGVVWALREAGVSVPGLDVFVDSMVPVGAGLSSSAALECAMALALAPDADPRLLRDACVRAETESVGAPTGGLDQTVVLLGRPGHALLIDFADGSTHDVPWHPEDAGLRLLVVDTGVAHANAGGGYARRRAECEAAADALGRPLGAATAADVDRLADPLLRRRARHVVSECDRVRGAVRHLGAGDWPALGRDLDASHDSLRDDFEVSCPELDLAVDTARSAGARGARLTGGGFGGSAIALVPEADVERVTSAVDSAFAAAGLALPTYLLA
jgi:galactokinase